MSHEISPQTNNNTKEKGKVYTVSEIKHAVDFIYRSAQMYKSIEQTNYDELGFAFPMYDSVLNSEATGLFSSIEEKRGFDVNFIEILDGKTISQYLKENYGNRAINVAEFGGPFSKGAKSLEKNGVRVNESIGVTLIDHRSDDEKWDDSSIGHTIVEANIFALSENPQYGKKYGVEGMKRVSKWVEKHGKIDFILSRLGAPLSLFNPETEEAKEMADLYKDVEYAGIHFDKPDEALLRSLFLKATLQWYSYLSADGTMLLECPSGTGEILEKAVSEMKNENGDPVFEIQTSEIKRARLPITKMINADSSIIKIKKLPGSPNSINLEQVGRIDV